MSVGPAALGNVLVQRLDAVLGTTMSAASANQVSGARPDAVSQPGSLEKPGQADGSPRDPRQGVQTGGARGERAAIVDAKTAAALAWPRAAWSQQRHHRFRAHHAGPHRPRDSLAAGAVPRRSPARSGRAPLWTPMHRPAASPVPRPGSPPQASRRRRPAPAPHANTPAGQPQAAAANSAANVATVLNAIAGDPATAAGKTPGQTGATEGAPPPKTRPPPPRRVGRAGSGRPRAGPGPARSPADQRPVLRITPGRSGLRPRQPIRAAQRTAGRPQAGRRPAAATQRGRHARTRRGARQPWRRRRGRARLRRLQCARARHADQRHPPGPERAGAPAARCAGQPGAGLARRSLARHADGLGSAARPTAAIPNRPFRPGPPASSSTCPDWAWWTRG